MLVVWQEAKRAAESKTPMPITGKEREMSDPATIRQAAPWPRRWWFLLVPNLCLGVVLWFFYFTDYSWSGTIPDIVFPPVVAVISFVSLLAARNARNRSLSRAARLACLPPLIGGGSYVLMAALLLMPPFTLGALFTIDEISNEKLIQEAPSPDGTRVAEVYFRGVGAYASGNGRIYVRVKHRLLPFVERDVYHLHGSHVDQDTTDYLSWSDSDALYIPETHEQVAVGMIGFQIPSVFAIPVNLLLYTVWLLGH
jgi:hypothetical protein